MDDSGNLFFEKRKWKIQVNIECDEVKVYLGQMLKELGHFRLSGQQEWTCGHDTAVSQSAVGHQTNEDPSRKGPPQSPSLDKKQTTGGLDLQRLLPNDHLSCPTELRPTEDRPLFKTSNLNEIKIFVQ